MTRTARWAAALALMVLLPGVASAQYFGRNKVQYDKFKFKIIQTQHFDIHYYDREEVAALDVARMAERSYAKLARILSHEFTERKPIILYASHSQFQQTNTAGSDVDEGTGGFTDYLLHRNIFPLTGAYDDIEHVLQHEMTHQFQFDIWSRGRGIQGIIAVNAPLWWGEGMAEYLSLGPIDANTAMWLRDAALEGKLPTPRDFYQIFPYRFGHALVSYVGARWGDEAISAITKAATGGGGIEGAINRVTGLRFDQLVAQWQDAVQKQYLPEIGDRVKARTIATPLLTEQNSQGGWHLAPALSPDGTLVAYFSEKNFYFVDLYLADGNTGKPIRRLLKSSYSSNYETYRWISSSTAWSADGKYLVFAAKREGRDDIVIVDPRRNKEIRRIKLPVDGVTTPAFSPDGRQIVFSGLAGGLSDLYVIDADGKNLRQLTDDKFADLHPTWSPDGRTIAFVTDRGPDTDLSRLVWGNYRIALLDVESTRMTMPEAMAAGKNVSPQWAPDGNGIAFVSDRTGVNNLFLYESSDSQAYQLTDFYTGIQGITALSPVLSWSAGSDRLAFVYFEQGKYDVYTLSSPRSRKKDPWRPDQVAAPLIALRPGETLPRAGIAPGERRPEGMAAQVQPPKPANVLSGVSLYRTPGGFRPTDSLGAVSDSTREREAVSIARILDSTDFDLPDTAEFVRKPYRIKYNPEYVSQPTIGYARDNFGRGLYGQASIVLGDMLGDHKIGFATTLNGRLEETSLIAQYANFANRVTWVAGIQQQPYYGYGAAGTIASENPGEAIYVEQYRRYIYRTAFGALVFPTSRFRRWALNAEVVNADESILEYYQPYDLVTGYPTDAVRTRTQSLNNDTYFMPSVALVFDNSLSSWVGPFLGRRTRIEVAQAVGNWQFFQGTFDYRRYDKLAGPVTLASRLYYFGRRGREAERFVFYGGSTELVRGHTYGSYTRDECLYAGSDPTSACAVNNLIGSQVAVGNIEIRIPLLLGKLSRLPIPLPGLQAAFWYDIGLVWDNNSVIKWNRSPGDPYLDLIEYGVGDMHEVRTPVQAFGASLRANVLGFMVMRLDYARPLDRPRTNHLWTLSLGPMF
jgi:Tol biopolymer transport system component